MHSITLKCWIICSRKKSVSFSFKCILTAYNEKNRAEK